ncbi:MAG TPA: thiamine pyrophosphate-binding protein [Pseudonocardiaceae bacterium]
MKPVDALLHILAEEGVRRIFGNPGTTELPLTDRLAEASDMDYLLGVHELAVVAMADGYARMTGRPSFVNLHVAAGTANGALGMLNASRSRTPMVLVAGQQDRRHLIQDPMLSGDTVGIASAVAKQAFDVQHAADLPVLLRRAFTLATTPPQGPVFLSVPMDLLAEDTDVPVPGRSTIAPPGPATGIAEAARLLTAARSPAIIAGDGVGRDGAVRELTELAEALGATVYPQPMHDGVNFPGTHPLLAPMPAPRNAAIRAALTGRDTVFVVGTHAFMPHHYTPGPAIPEGVTVLQLDTDPTEIGRNFAVRAGLVGAIAPTLAALTAALGPFPDRAERTAATGARIAAERAAVDAEALAAYGGSPLHPLAAAHAIAAGLPPGAVVVDEAITVGVHLRKVFRPDRPRSFVHTIGGGLGWGIGAAIGTRLGAPERPVVAVLGDGSAMFGLQGLWSAARYQVPVLFTVMNNGEYRTLKDTLDNERSRSTRLGRYVGLDLHPPDLDWRSAAAFFGVRAVRAQDAGDLREIVASAAELDAPLLVDVPVHAHETYVSREDPPTIKR